MMVTELFRISLLAACSVAACAAADSKLRAAMEMQMEWIRSHGGFQSPKIELLHNNKTGFVATEPIDENETLLRIPSDCLLSRSFDECDTADSLVREYKLGNESKYAPYIDFAFDLFHTEIHPPSMWSDAAAKTLLHEIIGRELPPSNVTGISFQHECGGSGDALEEQALSIVVSKGYDDTMIPLLELIPHRNGKWRNVKTTHDENDGSIHVTASRDILPGQELYQSFNECGDCDFAYVLQDMFKDSGILEDYPRRWRLEEPDLIFELDQVGTRDELTLTWVTQEPSQEDVFFLKGHLTRLHNLEDYIAKQSVKIESTPEREALLEYYHALVTALEYAVMHSSHDDDASDDFDKLDSISEEIEFNTFVCDYEFSRQDDSELFVPVEETESYYQSIIFTHSEELKDTCLYMDHYLHTCISWRSHYHEYLVHYAARYVNEVKRVLFMGGGDSMIVHEVLKYPSLELVVGLELDQAVVRKSFKNMGTQPHFDDERVQWWFGDATTSLLLLPTEYHGTFDLVLIDLAQEIIEMLNVTEGLDINDAAMLLVKPDGVLVRNEDWNFGTSKSFAKHMVDLYFVDVPMTCHQGLTMASNGVDFLTRNRKDHSIDTVYLKSEDEMDNRFHRWYNYRKSTNVACKEVVALAEDRRSALGILMVIEAEDVAISIDLSSAIHVSRTVSQAFQTVGLSETSVRLTSRDEGYQLLFILKEGYVVAQFWPNYSHCAFDVMLWRSTEKLDLIKSCLVEAVGSKSVSSYRIVVSGMFSADKDIEKSKVGPRTTVHTAFSHQGTEEHSSTTGNDAINIPEQSVLDVILKESSSLIEGQSILVLCGDPSSLCNSLKLLEKENVEPTAVWAWPSLLRDPSQKIMKDFAKDTLAHLLESVEATKKYNGIVIDPKASHVMGQVLHKMLSNTKSRRELLAERHVVFTLSTDPSDSLWRRALLDRFRTDFAKYDPSYRAEILFTDTGLELGVFSSGDDGFFSGLVNVVENIESKTDLRADVRSIKNGINNYVADFVPSKVASHDDYDNSLALNQWNSQRVLGEQSVIQYEAAEDLTTILLEQALNETLSEMSDGNKGIDVEKYNTGGAGSVIVGDWTSGSVVVTWDGKRQVNVNLISSSDPRRFERGLMSAAQLRVTSRNEMPRGTGRVVNFPSDMEDKTPRWSLCL